MIEDRPHRFPKSRRIVLFDIDGTLLLSGGAGMRALNRLFENRYRVNDAFAGTNPQGMTDPAIFRQMIRRSLGREPETGEIDDLGAAYVDLLAEELDRSPGFRLMPGVSSLLDHLAGFDSAYLGLATGNLAATSRLKLRRAGLDHHFRFGGFGSDAEDRARLTRTACERGRNLANAPDAPAFVIGDTIHDVRAARAAGARCLAVTTTGTDRTLLEREGAHRVLEDLTDRDRVIGFLDLIGA